MRTSHRPNIPQTNAYDDMVKRKIGGGGSSSSISTPGRPQKPNSYDIPSRSLLSTELQPHKTLALRSLSLQDNPSPASPRKLSSSNNPHWDPESVSVLTSPSIISSRQSYYSDARASPTNDVFSTATSMTSYGGSGGGSSNMQSKFFGEIGSSRISPQALQSHSTRESGLSLAMMAQSNASSPTSISPLYSSAFQQTGHSPGRQGPGVEYVGINNFKPEHQDQKSGESSARNMRPPYLQEEVVILPPHPSDHLSHYHNNHPNRHTMKRKGAPDLSERDGPPSQQLQQEGRRSPSKYSHPSYSHPTFCLNYPIEQGMMC